MYVVAAMTTAVEYRKEKTFSRTYPFYVAIEHYVSHSSDLTCLRAEKLCSEEAISWMDSVSIITVANWIIVHLLKVCN